MVLSSRAPISTSKRSSILSSFPASRAAALKEAPQPEFREYQGQVLKNARAMADSFVERSYKIVLGGTDDHFFVVHKGSNANAADAALGAAHIAVDENAVPNDPKSLFVTSGSRIGTPAITTCGLEETEAHVLMDWICDGPDNIDDTTVIDAVRVMVSTLRARFRVHPAMR